MKKVFIQITLVILFALVTLNVFADRVFIGFADKPGPAEQALVRGVGGKIRHTFNIVPAISADLPAQTIEALQKNPIVTSITPVGQVKALDAELDNSWGVKHIGGGIVHDSGNKGAGIKVAVLDTGIDYTHTDLDANVKGGVSFVDYTTDYMDDHGHGTHVSGIIAAEDNNIAGSVVGAAPATSLYGVKVLDSQGSGWLDDIVMGIQWCTVNGINIINMSFGTNYNDIWLEAACMLAYQQDGLLLVAAAGNDGLPNGTGDNVDYPGAYSDVMAVAATDQSNTRAPWSSTGPQVELSAPGVAVNSTFLGGGYEVHSGTSMASPHVAGTAALVWAAHPTWANFEVRQKMRTTADDLGQAGLDTKYGYGLVDTDEAAGVTPQPTTVKVSSITYKTARGGKDLLLYVTLMNEFGGPVAGATVSVALYRDSVYYGAGTNTTNSSGVAGFKAQNAPAGYYTTTVTQVIAAGLTWDGVTPANGYQKGGGGIKGTQTVLMQNAPNPFNPETWIPYQLAEDVDVTITIHDTTGHLIRTLDLGSNPAGLYTTKEKAAYWDGKNESGERVSSGIYFYTIQAGDFTATRKMIIVK